MIHAHCASIVLRNYIILPTQDDCRSLYGLRFPAPSERAAAFAAILMKGSAPLVKSAFSSCCVTEHR